LLTVINTIFYLRRTLFTFMNQFIFALFFFIPAFVANGMAALSQKIPIIKEWSTPIDFGKNFKGKRIFGKNKTIRGFFVGTLFGFLSGFLQFWLIQRGIANTDFTVYVSLESTLKLSALMSFGALFGDLVKSFFKRRFNIPPGDPWLPFDWLDYFFGASIFSLLVTNPGIKTYLILLFIVPLVSLVCNIISKEIGLKKRHV